MSETATMPVTSADGGGGVTAYTWAFVEPEPRETPDLFDARVGAANRLILIPRTALAASLLAAWLGSKPHMSTVGTMRQGDSGKYGGHTDRMEITFESAPMLSGGDDPYYTGVHLSAAEAAACRKLVGGMRAKAAKGARKHK